MSPVGAAAASDDATVVAADIAVWTDDMATCADDVPRWTARTGFVFREHFPLFREDRSFYREHGSLYRSNTLAFIGVATVVTPGCIPLPGG